VKPTLSALVCILLFLFAAACDRGSGKNSAVFQPPAAARAVLPQIEIGSDVDDDSDSYPREPPDNEDAQFGRPASSNDARPLASLVRRYYADAARGDSAAACRLLYLTRAETVAAEGYGGTAGRLGGSCAHALSSLFRQLHGQLSADSAALRVGAVRDEFNTASVQLFFGRGRSARYIEGHRERGAWKLGMLLDGPREINAE
jgi:hypothetical protein